MYKTVSFETRAVHQLLVRTLYAAESAVLEVIKLPVLNQAAEQQGKDHTRVSTQVANIRATAIPA